MAPSPSNPPPSALLVSTTTSLSLFQQPRLDARHGKRDSHARLRLCRKYRVVAVEKPGFENFEKRRCWLRLTRAACLHASLLYNPGDLFVVPRINTSTGDSFAYSSGQRWPRSTRHVRSRRRRLICLLSRGPPSTRLHRQRIPYRASTCLCRPRHGPPTPSSQNPISSAPKKHTPTCWPRQRPIDSPSRRCLRRPRRLALRWSHARG